MRRYNVHTAIAVAAVFGLLMLALVVMTLPASAQQAAAPAPAAAPPDPLEVAQLALKAAADVQERVAALEKEAATKKEVAALRAQLTTDRSRFASAIYRIAGESEPDALGRNFGRDPRNNAGHLLASASDTAKRIGTQPAPAAPEPAAKPAEPAPAPAAQAVPGAPAPVRVAPAPAPPAPSDRDRDRKVADAIEQVIGGLAGVVHLLRQ